MLTKRMSPRASVLSGLALLAFLSCCRPSQLQGNEQEIRLGETSVIRFATMPEAEVVMTARDDFIESLSRFDLECRLRTSEDVSVDQLLKHIPGQIREWSAEEQQRLMPVLAAVGERLQPWQLPFPETVLLIKTSGAEDAGAPYCRGNAIVLPEKHLAHVGEGLMLHELFHILSRTNAKLREKLYAVVGFTIGPDLELPEELRPIKITNPDAPKVNCYIKLDHNAQQIWAVPILLASAEHFDPDSDRSLFGYLKFHLLVVEQHSSAWKPKPGEDGKPILLSPRDVPSYFEQIGRNTKYIIHPEEVLADNFVHLIKGARDLPTPRVLQQMADLLKPSGE